MNRKVARIDIAKIIPYVLKRLWLIVLCAELGFAAFYFYNTRYIPDTYTAFGTMYVNNGNPELNDSQYTSSGDLNSAVQLIKTYLVVVKSDQVMNAVTQRIEADYPGVDSTYISKSLNMNSVSETGVVRVTSTTTDPRLSTDIVNVVMEVAPEEIIRVVGAGNIEIIDHATVPVLPNRKIGIYAGLVGAVAGAAIAAALIIWLYMTNQKITDTQDLDDSFTPPVLASIKRVNSNSKDPSDFSLNNQSPMDIIESYSKLRMNLLFTLVGKEKKAVVVTSAISGEGKSTIASNLAISCAMGGKKVLLIDGDLRRASQTEIFKLGNRQGLSEVLVKSCSVNDAILKNDRYEIDILPAGHFPPNPAELLESVTMKSLLKDFQNTYDLVILDMPPINIVSDPLVLSADVAGCLFVTRQNYSDYRDVRKALIAAEMTGMNVLGFVFYGEKLHSDSYYSRRYYKNYYNKYDYRKQHENIVKPESVQIPDLPQKPQEKDENVQSTLIKPDAAKWMKLRRKSTDHQ